MPAAAPLVHVRGDATVNWLTVDNALSSSEGEFTAEHDEYGHHRFIPLMFHGGARSDAAFIQSMLQSHDTAHEMFDGNLALEGSSPPCSLRLCLRADLETTGELRTRVDIGKARAVSRREGVGATRVRKRTPNPVGRDHGLPGAIGAGSE